MKFSYSSLLAISTSLILTACSSNSDSVENAQKVNEARNEAQLNGAAEQKADYDTEFVTQAASGGLLEVELGRLVVQRAATAEAKQFAQHMIEDHSKANAELMTLAKNKQITLPTMMSNDHQDVYEDIADKKGVYLDREYLHEMRQDHEEDVKLFGTAASQASDPTIRAFAARTLPRLQQHLAMAINMEAALKAKK